jgi:3-keto-5-aminohexanoate cleavage enzyme
MSNFYSDPLIITTAPNGAYKQLSDHAQVPLTAESLARTAKQCLDAGAAMLHLHIRDAQGGHSLDVQGYRNATATVRAVVGKEMVLQITSEAAKVYQAPAQIAMVQALRPEAVSVGLREVDQPEIGEKGLADFFAGLVREKVMAQVIIYDVKDLQRWQDLRQRGVIGDAPWFLLFVLGRYTAGQTSNPTDLVPFVHAHTTGEPWAVCAFGATEHACVSAAASLGGHVRVGFENNLFLKNGEVAPDNAALVTQAADATRSLGRPIATAAQIRERFAA